MRHRRWQVKIILSMDRSHLVATAAHQPSSLGAKKRSEDKDGCRNGDNN